MHEESEIQKEQPPQFQQQLWVFSLLEFQYFASIEFFQFFFWYQTEKKREKYPTKELKLKSNAFFYWMLVLSLPSVLSFHFSVPVLFTAGRGEEKFQLSLVRSI